MSFLSLPLRVVAAGISLFALVGGSLGLASPLIPSVRAQSDTTAPPRPFVKKLFIRGMTEAALADYEEAIMLYEQALDRAPREPALLQALADAHAARGEYTTALFYARQARKHGEGQAYYHRRLAEVQRQAGHPDAAIQTYRDLLARFPKNVDAYRALARLQSDLDRPRAALRTYDRLLERQSTPSVEVYREMLRLYRRIENPQGERKTLQSLLERRPTNRRYRSDLAQLYAETNQLEAAIDLLEPLLKETPNDTALRRQLQHLYREAGRPNVASALAGPRDSLDTRAPSVAQLVTRAESIYDDATSSLAPDTSLLNAAEELLERVLEQAPKHVEALILLARIHEQKGKYQQAGAVLERALDENPRVPNRWARAAAAYLNADHYEKAAALAEEGMLLFPGHDRLARTAAFARLQLRDAEQALEHFREALKLQSEDTTRTTEIASLKVGLGRAYSHLDRLQKAEEAYEEALSTAPNHRTALIHYAYLLARRNETLDRALSMAQRAVEHAPTDPNSLGVLGWVFFRKGNLQAARTHLQKALDAGATSARVFEHYGDVQHALGNEATARRYWRKALERAPNRSSLRDKLGGSRTREDTGQCIREPGTSSVRRYEEVHNVEASRRDAFTLPQTREQTLGISARIGSAYHCLPGRALRSCLTVSQLTS